MARIKRKEYLPNDFIKDVSPQKPDKMEDIVEKKISILYDLRHLRRCKAHRYTDPRENAVRRILTEVGKGYQSVDFAEDAMTRVLKKVVRFEINIDQFIDMYGG